MLAQSDRFGNVVLKMSMAHIPIIVIDNKTPSQCLPQRKWWVGILGTGWFVSLRFENVRCVTGSNGMRVWGKIVCVKHVLPRKNNA